MNTAPEPKPVSLLISCGTRSTEGNRTGAWRFVRPVTAEKTAPCSAACPAGQNIAAIEMLAARGCWTEAAQAILMENPFPSVCGRVCYHPCEAACNRGRFDEAVAVSHIERHIGDRAGQLEAVRFSGAADPVRVAVMGAGPAGLSAAYFLARLGHRCRVFEASASPGGLARWAIPSYRLPEAELQRDLSRLDALGVQYSFNTRIDADAAKRLAAEYDAVFFACGQNRPLSMGIEGEAHAMDGTGFLASLRAGRTPEIGGTVAVIGGGNTAVDAARCLLRLGAQPVIVYRRRRDDMPAFAPEVAMALEEGVALRTLQAPVRLEPRGGRIVAVFLRTQVVEAGPGGRARVAPVDGSETESVFDAVVSAVGAGTDAAFCAPEGARDFGHCRIAFGAPLRIWGGDVTNSNRSVADAVGSGKAAALAVDAFFSSGTEAVETVFSSCRIGDGPALSFERYGGGRRQNQSKKVVGYEDLRSDYFAPSPRAPVPVRPAKERKSGFSEAVEGLAATAVQQEADRCFNCGICNDCDNCRVFCPDMAVTVDEEGRRFLLDFCKGCGICASECPRCALDLSEEP
jgi:NADPH-dependent glutamate synthase beta subunit-like oxidoreductase